MKNSQKGSILAVVLVIIVLVLIGAGAYYYFQHISAPAAAPVATDTTTQSVKAFDDSALAVSQIPVSDSDNASIDLQQLKGLLPTSDSQTVSNYLNNKTPSTQSIQQAKTLLTQRANALKIFNQAIVKPKYYCNLNGSNGCNLSDVRNITSLAVIQADIFFRQGKSKNAMDEAFSTLDLGQKIENSADTFITYLVGLSVKTTALAEIQTIAQSGKLTASDKATYKQKLAQYTDDATSQKNTLKSEYQNAVKNIDAITSGDSSAITDPSAKQQFDAFQKEKNATTWNPAETKSMVYDVYKNELDNVDLACGSTYQSAKQDIDPSKLSPESENFIGKTFYAVSVSDMNSLNNKRCDLVKLYQSIQAALS